MIWEWGLGNGVSGFTPAAVFGCRLSGFGEWVLDGGEESFLYIMCVILVGMSNRFGCRNCSVARIETIG